MRDKRKYESMKDRVTILVVIGTCQSVACKNPQTAPLAYICH